MAVKEQCEQCGYYCMSSELCEKTENEPSFDGLFCDLFKKKTTLIEKTLTLRTTQSSENNIGNVNNPVRGWLLLFCILTCLGGFISLIYNVLLGGIYNDYGGSFWFRAANDSLWLIGMIIAIYSVYAISKRKHNAVFIARTYMVMLVAAYIIIHLPPFSDEDTLIIGTIINPTWSIIWFLFLTFSKQVKERFPKDERRVAVKDWVKILSMIYIPLFCLIMFRASGDDYKVKLHNYVLDYNLSPKYDDDSLSYDKKQNILSCHIQCEESDWLIFCDVNDSKVIILNKCREVLDEKLLYLLKRAKAQLRYILTSENIIKTIDITTNEINAGVSTSQLKQCYLNIIEKEAREVNAKCPDKTSENCLLYSNTFDRERTLLTITYVILHNKKDININVMKNNVLTDCRIKMIELCRENEIYKSAGLTIKVEYKDINHNLIAYTVIEPNDYME